MYSISGTRYLPLFFCFCSLLWTSSATAEYLTENKSDKINLALRRTADKLLRLSGDSTSRIPSIQKLNDRTWRVFLYQPFEYNALPALLHSSMQLYSLEDEYEVTIRRCEDASIDLGYHIQDYIRDTVVPCMGREEPEGCHYMEVVFSVPPVKTKSQAASPLLFIIILAAGTGAWFIYRKRKIPSIAQASEGDWIEFGKSRLHVSGQILESGGTRNSLTYRESKLLRLFALHPGQLLEREFILQQVWGDEGVQVGRSVDMFVSRLRKKLATDPSIGIVAVHGVGYRMETGVIS